METAVSEKGQLTGSAVKGQKCVMGTQGWWLHEDKAMVPAAVFSPLSSTFLL